MPPGRLSPLRYALRTFRSDAKGSILRKTAAPPLGGMENFEENGFSEYDFKTGKRHRP